MNSEADTLRLILVSGLPGTGKSTIGEVLARALKLPIFSVDPIESAVIRSGFTRSFETGLAAYLVAETLAAEQLKHGLSVIIDAVNSVAEARAMWRDLATLYNAQSVVIECVLEPCVHKQRIEARVRNVPGIPEVTWKDVEERRKEYLQWDEERLVVDMAESIEHNLAQILMGKRFRTQMIVCNASMWKQPKKSRLCLAATSYGVYFVSP